MRMSLNNALTVIENLIKKLPKSISRFAKGNQKRFPKAEWLKENDPNNISFKNHWFFITYSFSDNFWYFYFESVILIFVVFCVVMIWVRNLARISFFFILRGKLWLRVFRYLLCVFMLSSAFDCAWWYFYLFV